MTESVGKNKNKLTTSFQEKFQKFGGFLSGMVIPNIGAFIAFGLITAIFLETGWYPNEKIAKLISPLLQYLLPMMIGYTGGEMIYGKRGAVAGATVTLGLIVGGGDVAMFLGAMIMGPLGGFIIKKFDDLVKDKIPEGFEMIVNNFSLGIVGGIICILSYIFVGPLMQSITNILAGGVSWIIDRGILPLSAIFIEPARVLFLNNVIDHGIMAPLGLEQAQSQGFSSLFMIIPNPGIGLGILLAYYIYAKGEMKDAVPSAILIHFFGGIHEIFYPFVLANPFLILADIAGGIAAIIIMQITNYGTTYTPSPGSIISVLALTPKGHYLGAILTVGISCIVTFLVAAFFVKKAYKNYEEPDEEIIFEDFPRTFGKKINGPIRKIVVACDAGMGSSAMSASSLRKKLKNAGLNVEVIHSAIANIPSDVDLIVTHVELTEIAKKAKPNKAHISISSYINPKEFNDIENLIRKNHEENKSYIIDEKEEVVEVKTNNNSDILDLENIIIDESIKDRDTCLNLINKKFVEGGYTTPRYLDGLYAKEEEFNTNMGNGLAIPHGSFDYKSEILKTDLVLIINKNGIEWNGSNVKLVVGIAGKGDEHLDILAKISTEFDTEEKVDDFVKIGNPAKIKEILENKERK
ncbi:PTS mannitol transporter subunit IICBA [Anaerococcus sp. AGMB00486]|uniref:Mannitol-specific phosphotransferase enzyme IIA component n=1 Tax=Anaerococcus faecalis TaxID=2742993 RepID=A0ABX2NC82_9FIRM|nr:PTS mannitol transporter subunit IICBA [Anaerococcus faecalis]NVF12072.1 PTS mannitol transporter subunit IICBA [Anaerococcus faecalis]